MGNDSSPKVEISLTRIHDTQQEHGKLLAGMRQELSSLSRRLDDHHSNQERRISQAEQTQDMHAQKIGVLDRWKAGFPLAALVALGSLAYSIIQFA